MFTTVMLLSAGGTLLFALIWFVYVNRQRRRHRDLVGRSVPTTAMVVRVESHLPGSTPNDHMEAYFPVVRFETPQGPVEAEVLIGARPSPARTGQQVRVRYDPQAPHKVLLDQGGLASPGAFSCFGFALSIGMAGVAVLLLLFWYVMKVLLNFPG